MCVCARNWPRPKQFHGKFRHTHTHTHTHTHHCLLTCGYNQLQAELARPNERINASACNSEQQQQQQQQQQKGTQTRWPSWRYSGNFLLAVFWNENKNVFFWLLFYLWNSHCVTTCRGRLVSATCCQGDVLGFAPGSGQQIVSPTKLKINLKHF